MFLHVLQINRDLQLTSTTHATWGTHVLEKYYPPAENTHNREEQSERITFLLLKFCLLLKRVCEVIFASPEFINFCQLVNLFSKNMKIPGGNKFGIVF